MTSVRPIFQTTTRRTPATRVLVVDDTPSRHRRFEKILSSTGHKQVRHAFTAQEAITALGHSVLAEHLFEMVCLDHDLGTFDDGRTVASWMVENYPKSTRVLVHSQNPVGAQAIFDILMEGGFKDIVISPYKSA